MVFSRFVLGVILAGLILCSCGDRETKVAVPIELIEPAARGSEFEEWILALIGETCYCSAELENSVLKVPESKEEKVRKVLETWSGENVTGVGFHSGHPDQDPPLPPGRIFLPFRHDPERKGVIEQASIMGDSQVGISEASMVYGTSGWFVSVEFDEKTSAAMGRYTTANVGNQMAILFNGKILSMPVITEPFSNGASITGDFTEEEARAISSGIRNPPPAKFRIREERE